MVHSYHYLSKEVDVQDTSITGVLQQNEKHNDFAWSDPIENVLVVCPLSELYLLGSQVDYVEELGGSFLSVKNPISTSSCGCGESFGA
jgi:Fe-S cluster assembly iron-binding protein IscA